MLERLAVAASLQLLRVAERARLAKMLVAAAVIEVIVGVDDVVDVAGFQAQVGKLSGDGLRGVLDRFLEGQYPHDMVEIVAGVENIAAVGMLDEHAVAGKPDLTGRAAVPEGVKAVDHQRAAVEQMNLRVGHESELLWRSALAMHVERASPRREPLIAHTFGRRRHRP